MDTIVIATIKSWNIRLAEELRVANPDFHVCIITEPKDLNAEWLAKVCPKYIFFPHWSWIIPKEIYESYDCVVFHMTDLPFGRGGSPLQNLIVRGIYRTKISAIKVSSGMDTGPVYFKEPLDISYGSADDIFRRASDIVFHKMIPRLLEKNITPIEQTGEPVIFKRRKPEQSELPNGLAPRQLYDYIRMLDGEGYPPAFSSFANGKVFYRNARLEGDVVYADAEFRRNVE